VSPIRTSRPVKGIADGLSTHIFFVNFFLTSCRQVYNYLLRSRRKAKNRVVSDFCVAALPNYFRPWNQL